jgi:hypothetical protein
MKITRTDRYAQDVETLFRAFITPDDIVRRYEGMGARGVEVRECKERSGGWRVVVRREMPAEVPSALKRFVQPWNEVVQTDEWKSQGAERVARLTADVKGVPVNISGRIALRARDGGSEIDVALEVGSGIPLIGRKLAQFVGENVERTLDQERDFLSGYEAG